MRGRARAWIALPLALLALVASVIMMFDFQTQIIFPTHAVGPAGPLPSGAERLSFKVPGAAVLQGVHIPPTRRGRGARTMILGFAGNAWNSEDAATYLHMLYPNTDVVAFHYRGYRPSTGTPSAKALLADAPLVYDFAKAHVAADRIVAVGFSIGTGVAAVLAGKRPLDGLILVTPFDSLKAVASGHYPWLPVGAVFEHEIDAASALAKSDVPVAIIGASRDELIPTVRTDALRRRVRHLVFDRAIAGAGHNDIYHRSEFHDVMRDALRQLLDKR